MLIFLSLMISITITFGIVIVGLYTYYFKKTYWPAIKEELDENSSPTIRIEIINANNRLLESKSNFTVIPPYSLIQEYKGIALDKHHQFLTINPYSDESGNLLTCGYAIDRFNNPLIFITSSVKLPITDVRIDVSFKDNLENETYYLISKY